MTDPLRESEEQFEALFNYAPLGVYLVDSDLVIRKVNPVALPVFGDIPGGPVGRDFDEVIHILWTEEYADEVVGIFRQTLETGESYVTPERAGHRSDRDAVEYYEWRVDRIPLPGRQFGVVCYFRDISAQVYARQEIEKAGELARVNEDRQAFLLKLSDALRPLGDAMEVQTAALRVLGEQLAVNRAFFNEVDEEQDTYVIHRTYADGVAPLTGRFRLGDIRKTAELAGSGQIVVFDDVGSDPRLSEVERASYAAIEVAAGVGVPLIKDGRWVAGLGVHHATPRHWTPEDIDLIRETAERTWAAVERAQAEAALRENESRLRTLFDSIDEGFMEVEVVMSADGRALDWRYLTLNAAFQRLTGLPDVTGKLVSEFMPDLEPDWAERLAHVVNTGEAIRFELPAQELGRWFEVYYVRVGNAGSRRVAAVYNDVTGRKQAEFALCESEERQAFLLKFSDALRPLGDPVEVQSAGLRVLGEHLGAVRAQYWEVEPDGEYVHSEGGYAKEGPRISGRVRLHDFGVHVIEAFAAGLTVVVSDVTTDPLASEAVLAAYDAVGVRAYITVPLVKGGRLVALLAVHHTAARDWTSQEIALSEETAERTWAAVERARAEAVLRDSEARYRALFEAIDAGFCILEMIFDESGRAIDYRFVEANPSFERQSGLLDAVGRRIREFTPDLEEHWFERYGRVALTGEPMRVEGEVASLGRWFDINAFRVGVPEQRRIAVLFTDVSERRHAEAAARESEARQAFLLRLSDALRAEPGPEAIANRALRMLFEQMGLDRCYVGVYRLAEDIADFPQQVHDDRLAPLPAQVRLSDFPDAIQVALDRTLVVDDVAGIAGLSEGDRASFDGLGLRAVIAATLRKGENNPLWAIVAGSSRPRVWTQGEISFVEEVAERTWAAVERARAEGALRESEGRYHELLDSIDEGFCVLEMIADDAGGFRDYRFLQINPMFEAQTGLADPIGRTALELAPGLERWWIDTYGEVATTGEARRFEHGSETLGRWFDVYAARVGEPGQLRVALLFRDISERKRAEGHRQILIDELNHRVKNTLAIVQGLAQQTFRPGGDPQAARRAFDLRLVALARAHDILTRENWASADLAELVHTALAVHAGNDGRMVVEGPPVRLPPQTAVSITLALHELATNAVKYGALSVDAGSIEMRWTHDGDRLSMTWAERDGPPVVPPTHRGFGTRLVERVFANELKAKVAMEFPPEGLICRIDAHVPASFSAGPTLNFRISPLQPYEQINPN